MIKMVDQHSGMSGAERSRPSGSPPTRLIKQVGRSVLTGKRYYQAKRLIRAVTCRTGAIRCQPDFLVIGAQKSGSSSLFFYLQQHPHVMLPINVTKEVHFFDQHYDRGMTWYQGHFPVELSRKLVSKLHGQRMITGEATPEYLVHPRVPSRVARDLPNARCIAMLRNPIDRAWSHYKMEVKRTAEKRSFEDAVAPELESGPMDLASMDDKQLASWNAGLNAAYLTRGIYADQLERWTAQLAKDQIMVILAEDLFANTAKTYEQISSFLGISPVIPRDLNNVNQGGYRDQMNPQTRERLTAYFQPDIQRLAEILGRRPDWS